MNLESGFSGCVTQKGLHLVSEFWLLPGQHKTRDLFHQVVLQGVVGARPAALAHEMATISLVLDTDDAHEGCSAFLEKRQATFRGS